MERGPRWTVVGRPLNFPPRRFGFCARRLDNRAEAEAEGKAGMHLQANLPDPPIRQGLAAAGPTPDDRKPKKKICCACPDTKKLRDECIVEHGEAACQKRIQAHLQCLRAEGFKV
ncbi:cytochrome c oxidase copper chaperone [Musa troglodytarum]|uniref:Cytochrome c oxidase copper chaperone n=1 Tax=Musa troglodytarum TaxID=320322 RepID=A0A9E7HNL2_9LILI|nr:cytochrome c oxidase copper chaperone [Musa troglodytarum]